MCRYVPVSVSYRISSFHKCGSAHFDYLMQVYSWFAPGLSWVCTSWRDGTCQCSTRNSSPRKWKGRSPSLMPTMSPSCCLSWRRTIASRRDRATGWGTHSGPSSGGSLLKNNMEVEAAMELQRLLDETGVHLVCTNYVLWDVWVCTMFDQSLLVENKFTRFTLSKLFWFPLNLHKFTQFALILHQIYTESTHHPAFFLGKKVGW